MESDYKSTHSDHDGVYWKPIPGATRKDSRRLTTDGEAV